MNIIEELRKKTGTAQQKGKPWAVNFYFLVESIDEDGKAIVGRRFSGRGGTGKPFNVILDPKYTHPNRPTWEDMRNPHHKCFLETGQVLFVQNANSAGAGVWSARWINRLAKTAENALVLRAIAKVSPAFEHNGTPKRVSSFILPKTKQIIKSEDELLDYVSSYLKRQAAKGTLIGSGLALHLFDKETTGGAVLAKETVSMADAELDLPAITRNIVESESVAAFIEAMNSNELWTNDGWSLEASGCVDSFVSPFHVQRVTEDNYMIGDKPFWRDSYALFARVVSKTDQKPFWSLQSVCPISMASPWMPNAHEGDAANLTWEQARELRNQNKQTG